MKHGNEIAQTDATRATKCNKWRLLPSRCGECCPRCLLPSLCGDCIAFGLGLGTHRFGFGHHLLLYISLGGTAPATTYLKKTPAYEHKKGQYDQQREQNQKWPPTRRNKIKMPDPNSRGHAKKGGLRVPDPKSWGHATKRGLRVPNPNSWGHATKRGLRLPKPLQGCVNHF